MGVSRDQRKAAENRRTVLRAFDLTDEPKRSRPGRTSARRDECEGQGALFDEPKKPRGMW